MYLQANTLGLHNTWLCVCMTGCLPVLCTLRKTNIAKMAIQIKIPLYICIYIYICDFQGRYRIKYGFPLPYPTISESQSEYTLQRYHLRYACFLHPLQLWTGFKCKSKAYQFSAHRSFVYLFSFKNPELIEIQVHKSCTSTAFFLWEIRYLKTSTPLRPACFMSNHPTCSDESQVHKSKQTVQLSNDTEYYNSMNQLSQFTNFSQAKNSPTVKGLPVETDFRRPSMSVSTAWSAMTAGRNKPTLHAWNPAPIEGTVAYPVGTCYF